MKFDKSMIVIVAVVALMVVGIAAYGSAGKLNSTNQTKEQNLSDNNNNSLPTNSQATEQSIISASEAQSIAQKYIEEPGATAGTPDLVEKNGQKIYIVPVILNGQTVGEIHIDAITGNNVGGAGGVT